MFYYNKLLMKGDVRVCVKQCMTQDAALEDADALRGYYNDTGSSFCWYNVEPDQFKDGASNNRDTCPDLPIEKQ